MNKTRDLTELATQIMTTELNPNVKLRISFGCKICGRWFNNLEECLRGLEYIPPDPFPVGTRVIDKRWKRAGVVIRSEILTSEEHQHRRIIEVRPDERRTIDFYYIFPNEDESIHLILESEWEGGRGAQGG